MRIPKFLQRLTFSKRLATVPVLFGVGAACLVAMMSYQVTMTKNDASRINLAGHQRMLNERHTREFLQIGLGGTSDYQATRELLMESIGVLLDGADHSFGKIPPAKNEDVVAALDQQEMAFVAVFKIADDYLQACRDNSENRAELREKLIAETGNSHNAAEAVVSALAQLSSSSSQKGVIQAFVFGAVIIVVCGGWSWVCGRSVSSQVSGSAHRVQHLSSRELAQVSQRLRQTANETTDQATAASGAAEQVNANAQMLNTSVQQFEQSIKEIAGNASNAASVARNAVDAAEQTNSTISRLGASSAEIGNVIKVINSIAEQTNLLALNATIEAARAGEAGKGFAVVANEVKELAKETSKATEDIIGRIGTIQTDTQEAVDAIGLVSEIISQINESQNAIAGAVEQQTAMTSEISRNISEVTSGSGEIARSISLVADGARSTSAGSEQTLATASSIELMASELMELVGQTANATHRSAELTSATGSSI